MIELIAEEPPASADAIDAAEQELVAKGQRLPPSYRAFLAQHDGGQPKLECFRYQQGAEEREGVINEFLGVRPVPPPGTNLLITAGLLRGRIPDGVLPIANDPYGNLICIDTRGGLDGPVLFWDHEFEKEDGPPDDANLYPIAPDFETFLDNLYADPQAPPADAKPKPKGLRRLFGR